MYIIIAVVVIVAIAACGICLVIGSRKKKEGFIIQGIITSVGKITYKRRVIGRTTYSVVSKDITYHEKIDLKQFPNISKIEGLAACFIVYEKNGQLYNEPIPGSGSQFVNISQIIKRLNIKTFFISDYETTGSNNQTNKPILPPNPTAPTVITDDEQIIADWKLCKSAPSEAQCTKALLGLKPGSKNQAIIDLVAYEVRPLQQTEKTINLFGGYTGFKTVIDAAHKIFAKEK